MTEQQRERRAPVRPRGPARNKPKVTSASGDDSGKRRTAAEVMADVGDDPDKAQQAYDDEMSSDKPRSTLIAQLEKVIGGDQS